MALKIELKPGERLILGDSLITNGDHRTQFYIEGRAPILREPDILRAEDAKTPCQKIYLAIQLMYLSQDPEPHHDMYFSLINDVQKAAPSTVPHIVEINKQMLTGSYYKALKRAKKLIAYEKELMENARRD